MHGFELPVPPPFMWACNECARLLDDITVSFALSTEHDLYEGAVRCQIMLAAHLTREHREAIPDPHDDCPRCAFYTKQQADRGMDCLWAGHRARDLFLPPGAARLI